MVAPSRRGRPLPVDETEGGIGPFLAEHRAGLGAVAVVVAAAFAGWAIWSRVSESASGHHDAILMPDAVELRGVAPWVRCDLKAEALRNASLDGGLPLDDPELCRRLARAFEMHPWVKLVVNVSPRHPAAATVEVLCREPVAMVGVKGGLLAVDALGVGRSGGGGGGGADAGGRPRMEVAGAHGVSARREGGLPSLGTRRPAAAEDSVRIGAGPGTAGRTARGGEDRPTAGDRSRSVRSGSEWPSRSHVGHGSRCSGTDSFDPVTLRSGRPAPACGRPETADAPPNGTTRRGRPRWS